MYRKRYRRDRVGRFARKHKKTKIYTWIVFIFYVAVVSGYQINQNQAQAQNKFVDWQGNPIEINLPKSTTIWVESFDPLLNPNPDIPTKIRQKAQEYGLSASDRERAVKIAKCESGFNPKAEHNISTASGIFQFTRPTWSDGIKWRNLDWSLYDRFDEDKNIDMAIWFMSRGEWSRWECDKLL